MKNIAVNRLLNIVYAMLVLFSSHLLLAETAQNKSILIIGDSLSAAYGLTEASGWVDLLSIKLKQNHPLWRVNNASISGETTAGGAQRIGKLLLLHKPRIVLIELGGNDGLRGFPLQITYNNLEKIITQSLQQNAKVIISGIHLPPNYGRRYEDLFYKNYTDLSAKYNLILVPFILQGIAENAQLMQADGIHPKENAQGMILNNVWPFLEPLL